MTFEKYSVAFFMHKNQTKLEIFNVHRRDFVFFFISFIYVQAVFLCIYGII